MYVCMYVCIDLLFVAELNISFCGSDRQVDPVGKENRTTVAIKCFDRICDQIAEANASKTVFKSPWGFEGALGVKRCQKSAERTGPDIRKYGFR